MEKDWYNIWVGLYHSASVFGGVGIGIILSNAYPIHHIYGSILLVLCFIISVYLWNTHVKKIYNNE